jgi:hypothetical protein
VVSWCIIDQLLEHSVKLCLSQLGFDKKVICVTLDNILHDPDPFKSLVHVVSKLLCDG